MTNEGLESAVLQKMDIVIKLLAANLVKGESPDRQVKLLSDLGMQPKDIATILGKNPTTVRTALHRSRRK